MGVTAGRRGSGEADVQDEVSEPQAKCSASGPVHDERQQDDGHDDDDHPEEEHDDAGNGVPGYCPGSSHGRQLPAGAGFIRRGSTDLAAGHRLQLTAPLSQSDDDGHGEASGRPRGPGAVLLHTDVHGGNVLAAERERWLAIDPKPYVGDLSYHVTQHIAPS